jgi:hypothetical protein
MHIPFLGETFSTLAINFGIRGGPGSQSVDVAVVHAEGCGDEHGVVDLLVGGAFPTCALDIFGRDLLAALLHFAGDRKQRLELVRNG